MLRHLSFFGLIFLLFWSCQKKKITPKQNYFLPVEVAEIKKQYEQTLEAQNLALSLDWEQADLQKFPESKVIQVPLKDQKNTYLVGMNNDFWYKRILTRPDGKQTVDLIYDVEGFLKLAIHAHERVDFYILKNEAYNFYEHHINSKSQKYHRWEDFDFLDFEYVENFQNLFTLIYKDTLRSNLMQCLDLSNQVDSGQIPAPYPEVYWVDCLDMPACTCARCDHYTYYVDLLTETCPPGYGHAIYGSISNQKTYCGPCYNPPAYVPCKGDILAVMDIAPTEAGGKKAGRYGDVRKDKYQNPRHHNGTDISAPIGTPFVAMYDGQVTFSSYKVPANPDPGKTCWIDPVDGICKSAFGNFIQVKSYTSSGIVYISYAHLGQMNVVNGQYVEQGQVLGLSGNSGNAVGTDVVPHVHISVYDNNGKPVDPEPYFKTKFDADGNRDPKTKHCKKK